MSKVLENRKSSFALATKKEVELTHIISIAYVKYQDNNHYSITSTNAVSPAINRQQKSTINKLRTLSVKINAIQVLSKFRQVYSQAQNYKALLMIVKSA